MPRYQPNWESGNGTAIDAYSNFKTKNAPPAVEAFEKLDAEGTRWVVERAMRSSVENAKRDEFHATTAPTFLKMYPAYINNDHNMKLMKHNWTQEFGVEIPTLEQLEHSFFVLRASDVLQLNKTAVAREDGARIAQHADEVINTRKARAYDEEKANTMSLEDLRRAANGLWD
jgi:hypothetical protein